MSYAQLYVKFTNVKMTMNCYYDSSVIGVILPVENKILPIIHLKMKLTKTHPLFYTFCQKHSGCVFASGKILKMAAPQYKDQHITKYLRY